MEIGLRSSFCTSRVVEGTVRAGDFFPQPAMFEREKPVGEETHRHVVLPAQPGAHFVVIHPDVILGDLEALLNPVTRAGDASEDLGGRGGIGIGEEVFVFGRRVHRSSHHQEFARPHLGVS